MADKYYGVERRAVNSEMWEQVLLSRCMCDELFQEGYLHFIWQIESGNRTLIQASPKDMSHMVPIVSVACF